MPVSSALEYIVAPVSILFIAELPSRIELFNETIAPLPIAVPFVIEEDDTSAPLPISVLFEPVNDGKFPA